MIFSFSITALLLHQVAVATASLPAAEGKKQLNAKPMISSSGSAHVYSSPVAVVAIA
jgi:hypothetical protein